MSNRGAMPIRAVVFDIGGVLELTEPGSLERIWEPRLGLGPGELGSRLAGVAAAGAVGAISEQQAGQRIAEILGLDASQLQAFLADLWTEYLGTLNTGWPATSPACGRATGPASSATASSARGSASSSATGSAT